MSVQSAHIPRRTPAAMTSLSDDQLAKEMTVALQSCLDKM